MPNGALLRFIFPVPPGVMGPRVALMLRLILSSPLILMKTSLPSKLMIDSAAALFSLCAEHLRPLEGQGSFAPGKLSTTHL